MSGSMRLTRDLIICALCLLSGGIWLASTWLRFDTALGVAIFYCGLFIAAKINARPFSALGAQATLNYYFYGLGAETLRDRSCAWLRLSIIYNVIPIITAIPIILLLKEIKYLNGYFISIIGVLLCGVFAAIWAAFLFARSFIGSDGRRS
jgi:hypothetical protein